MQRIEFIDTHTGGEPTRVVTRSSIRLRGETLVEQRESFRREYDPMRRAIVCEPRGNDVMVGALLTPPVHPASAAGVIFFNNVGYLGMCGHGTMGVAVALQHLGRIDLGRHQLDTPVGCVQFELHTHGRVSLDNVHSYRYRKNVSLGLDSGRVVHGDIAWGGNWFFICDDHGLEIVPQQIAELDRLTREIRRSLVEHQITGPDGAEIDHVELTAASTANEIANSRNYVMCPGGAYDRSPCGTGTSAKIACLAADRLLEPGQVFRQQSIVGSIFEASYRYAEDGSLIPTIVGSAFVNIRGDLVLDPRDPFCLGIELPGKQI